MPLDITKFTADPRLTLMPASGLSLMTLPVATTLLAAVVTVPTTKLAPVIDVVATACLTDNIWHGCLRRAAGFNWVLTSRRSTFTLVPASGFSLITLPVATVLLAAVVTVPTTKPSVVAVVVAACALTDYIWHRCLHRAAGYN